MKSIKDLSTKEIFEQLKESINTLDKNNLSDYEKNLLIALNNAIKIEQRSLIEQCLFYHKCLTKENELIELGFDKFIYKDDLLNIIRELTNKNDKDIFFIELDRYPRVIPTDVVKKVELIKSKNIFDEYYILYTDYTNTSETIDKINTIEKDPIIFGAFSKSNKDNTVYYMGERIYYIADWIDEYCDLTLDRLLREVPDKIHSLYGTNDIDLNIIEKLKESELGKELYDEINSEITKKKDSNIFWLVDLFNSVFKKNKE